MLTTGYVHLTLSLFKNKIKFPTDFRCLKDTGLRSLTNLSRDADEKVNKTQPQLTSNWSNLLQKNINKNTCPLLFNFFP